MIIITMSLIYLMIWFIQLIVLIFCIGMAIRIIQLQNYNPIVDIIHLSSMEEVVSNLSKLSPMLIYEKDYKLPKINFKDDISFHSETISLSSYGDLQTPIFIYKDQQIQLSLPEIETRSFPDSRLLLREKSSYSVIQGNRLTSIQRNIHNYYFLETIDGYSIIYLLNPKYKDNLQNFKENGYRMILQPKTKLYIPPNWYYIQEIKEKVIQRHIEIDDLFTFVPNFFKKNMDML
jgi:hypothetical protein